MPSPNKGVGSDTSTWGGCPGGPARSEDRPCRPVLSYNRSPANSSPSVNADVSCGKVASTTIWRFGSPLGAVIPHAVSVAISRMVRSVRTGPTLT